MEGTNQSFDSLPSKATKLEFSKLERKLMEELNIERLTTDILKSLNLYSDSNGYNHAAELLSDRNIIPGVDLIRFGNTIDEFLDRETYEGISIIKQFDSALSMFYKYYSFEKIEGSKREKKLLFPEKAFREALANALVHRTWDVRGAILVSMFSVRIEVSSPGGLPFGLSKQAYLAGQISLMRNPIIGNIFYRLKYIEMFGTGIRRINSSYADFIKKPDFRIFFKIQLLLFSPIW